MAEIRGDRVFIFGKDATDLVDVLSEIVCRELQDEAQQEAGEPFDSSLERPAMPADRKERE